MLIKAQVRGVYSTALTKLLLDHGAVIVRPSVAAKERFGLEERNEASDLSIRERPDRQGVSASGREDPSNTFKAILQSNLQDVIIREKPQGEAALVEFGGDRRFLDVEFPALSKKRLDAIRRSVTETVDGHHHFKACGGNFSVAVDMAERLLGIGGPTEEAEKLFRQTVRAGFPTAGSTIVIEHVKLDGRILHLGEARVEVFDKDESLIEFKRIVKGEGTYDALGTRREPGDRAVTEAKIGEWHYKTRYFSKDGDYKGSYINLNTPTELYPHGIRYVDLEVDICIWPNGKVGKVDEERLESAVLEGVVTQRLVETVREKVQELMETTEM
ncbi:MAG: DUF402 domain-containing protein [Candidatus Bathyarchaeota archaeon]|nr:MAG: DUF402 domain-containing protein [Candidatus Bathyarchaeota archaeon]